MLNCLQAALEQFRLIAEDLGGRGGGGQLSAEDTLGSGSSGRNWKHWGGQALIIFLEEPGDMANQLESLLPLNIPLNIYHESSQDNPGLQGGSVLLGNFS